MQRDYFSKMLAFIIMSSLCVAFSAKPPHIMLIVADDVGWNDVGWHNPDIITPNMNTLAFEGVILNNSYVNSVCSPSRASLLTGRYAFKMGMQHGAIQRNKPHGLPLEETLLPEELKKLGYSTHIVGKWHLGYCNWAYTPTYRGFDSFYGFYNGQEDYFTHKLGKENGYDFRFNTKIFRPKKNKYSTTDFGDRASKIIKHHNTEKPLFLYLPFQAGHTPLQVPKRFEYQYAHIRNQRRRLFSGMITAMDEAVGKVAKALIKRGMFDNTLIIFISDNGGYPTSGGNNWPLRGGKGTLWEGGTRVPSFIWGKMLKKSGYVSNELIHIVDWFPTILSIAGGSPDYFLDGVNQWDSLSYNIPGERQEFVYAINEISQRSAIRVGDYKLFLGSPGHYTDWYPAPTKRGRKMKIRKDLKLNHRAKNITLLYNIKEDPIESNNLAEQYPEIVSEMKHTLYNKYWQHLVPSMNPRKVRKSHPKFWDNVWSPGWC